MLFSSSTAFPALALLATTISTTIAHPLNLLHAHHVHHSHHHLHLRLPTSSSNPAPAAPKLQLQHPLNNAAAPALDISNVFVNVTLTSVESSLPTSILIPLRPSTESSSSESTSSVYQHLHTARISDIRYGTGSKTASRQFERAEDVRCYAYTAPIRDGTIKRREAKRKQLRAFRLSDGEISFAEAGKKGGDSGESVSSFSCVLES